MRNHTPIRRPARCAVSLCLTLVLLLSLCLPALAAQGSGSADDYIHYTKALAQQNALRNVENTPDPDEVLRVMVVTDVPTAVEQTGAVAYTAAAQTAETQSLRRQESVVSKVQRLTGNPVINRSAYLVSSFSMDMTRAQMEQVAAMGGVVSVSPVTTYQATMGSAKDMTSAMELWQAENGGYTGEGVVVSIIDSGINYSHPDMQMREGARLKYTQADMEEKIAQLGYGDYYTDKVPFGFSYVNESDVNNDKVTHGLHVAGIVAANGDEENGGVVGLAPDAQLFAMQVFGSSGSGYNDDIIRAVEDSVKLGADILNLSLGGTVGFYNDVEYLQKALATAQDNGILVCVAAGNDGASSSADGTNTNDWGVIDTGAVSSPSTYPGALSVASVDNASLRGKSLDILSGGETIYSGLVTDFSEGTHTDWTALGELPIVDLGYGDLFGDIFPLITTLPDSYVALVQRGNDITFEDKVNNASGFGHATAVIVYNNEATDEIPGSLSAGTAKKYNAVMVSGNTGAKLKELAKAGASVSFAGLTDVIVPNTATGGDISSFSSWGSTPTLDIKPEIAAPGGNIHSISKGSSYEDMSGTSMATPYVAGCSALVLEALQSAVTDGSLVLGDTSLNVFLKASLMNTADPIYDGDVIFSVRQQGSGLVDPKSAADNRVTVTYNGTAAVALKEVGNSTAFTLTLTNYGTSAATYTLPASVPVYTDVTDPDTAAYGMETLSGAAVTFSTSSVTVPAGGTATVTGTLTIPSSAAENHYVEAYLPLSGDVSLSVPLMGFYGDWYGCQRIVDLPAWDEDNIMTNYYDYLPVTSVAAGGSYAGFNTAEMTLDPDHIAFSPNGDDEFDTVQPLLGLLRSSQEITVDVLDESGKVVRQINHVENVAKYLGIDAYESQSPISMLAHDIVGDGTWDGTRYDTRTGKNVLCDEGQYTLRVRARMPGSDTVEETLLPVKLDVTAPQVHITSVSVADGALYLSYTAEDWSGIMNFAVAYLNGEELEFVPGKEAEYNEATGEYSVVLPADSYEDDVMNEIALTCLDYAYNGTTDIVYTNAETDAAVLFYNINNDDTLSVLRDVAYESDYDFATDSRVNLRNCAAQIRGIVSSKVAALTVNGVAADIDERGGFRVEIPVEAPGLLTLHVEAKAADGTTVFTADKPALFDVQSPATLAYVTTPDGQWDESMLWTTSHTADGYIYATRYSGDQLVPLAIQVSDESLTGITVSWLGGDTIDGEDFSDWLVGMDVEGLEVHTQNIPLDSLDENGRVYMNFPFIYKDQRYVDDETGEVWDYSAYCQIVRVEATDAAGNVSRFNALLYDTVYGKKMYDESGYEDVRNTDGMVRGGLDEFKPLWDNDHPIESTAFLIDSSWLDENGNMHVEATLSRDSNFVQFAGKAYYPEEGSRHVEFDIPIHTGLNLTYLTTYSDAFASNDMATTYRLYLYYLPDSDPMALRFDNEAIADGAVLYTNQTTFPISGDVLSRFGNVNLKVNGDVVLYPDGDINVAGDLLTKHFSYGAALQEGENLITVQATDATETEISLSFTVVLDTVAPEAPVVSQGDDGLVTITGEGDLYYSYDGTEWIRYTGPFAPTGTTIYAKAIDRAGNESLVAQATVTVSSGTDSPNTADEAAMGLWLSLMTVAVLAGAVLVLGKRYRA